MVNSGFNKPPRKLRECIEDLQQTYRVLPKVDKDGYSECPFAEDIYAKKQRHELEVANHLDRLKHEKNEVIKKIHALKNTLTIIDSDRESIHNLSAYEKYEQAEEKKRKEIKCLRAQLERLQLQINDLEILLGITGKKKWPNGNPESDASLNSSILPTADRTRQYTPRTKTGLSGLQRSMDNLFSSDRNRNINVSTGEKLK